MKRIPTNQELLQLLLDVKDYIEYAEVDIDAEGGCRSLKELKRDKAMNPIYACVLKAIRVLSVNRCDL